LFCTYALVLRLYEETAMKRSLSVVIILSLIAMLSGCIISTSPKDNPVVLLPGQAKTFTIRVLPQPAKYVWYVGGNVVPGATVNSFAYMIDDVLLPSDFTIEVRATTLLGIDKYTWNVHYVGTNKPPVAEAGPDQITYVGYTVTLDGSGSTDPDNNIISYHWEQIGGSQVTLSNQNVVKPHFVADVPGESSLTFELKVTDAGDLSSTDTCIVTVNSMPSPTPGWTMFRHDRQHTGRSEYVGAQVATQKWAFTTGDYVQSSPAIGSDGTVYVGGEDNKVYALDGETGNQKWAFTTGGGASTSPAIGADGTVYVGSFEGIIHALDGETGNQKWAFTMAGYVSSSPTIGVDGTVYVGGYDGKVYALDGATGTQKWAFTTGGWVRSSPAIGADGTVYVGSYNHKVYALVGATGNQKWEFLTGNAVYSSPAIGTDGTVYVGSEDKKVYALDGATGTQKWAFTTGNMVDSSPAIGSDGTVYVGSYDGKVYALDGATGAQKWAFTTGGGASTSPAIGADGTVYVGSYDRNVYAIGE
jgi:outer membrane protein assembly factor BamB